MAVIRNISSSAAVTNADDSNSRYYVRHAVMASNFITVQHTKALVTCLNVTYYTVIQKTSPLFIWQQFLQMLTDFYYIWHTVYWVYLQHIMFIDYPPHLYTVATLPWKASQAHNDNFQFYQPKLYILENVVRNKNCVCKLFAHNAQCSLNKMFFYRTVLTYHRLVIW